MKRRYQRYVREGKLCPCGEQAVRYFCGTFSCQGCIDKDRAIYATERIRGTCGFPGAGETYRALAAAGRMLQ